MKRQNLIFIFLFCFSFLKSKAQIIITGTVTDSAGSSLQNVTVSVINTETKAVRSFAITNAKGYFEIKLSTISKSAIRVTSIGYQSIEKVITENILTYNFKLNSGIYSLPEVLVKSQNLVTGKGDTLNYNVQQFVRPQDRTIGDVIKNLPGITISTTGTINYNGRPINKFYIDGDDILGDKYVIGTNTLPADAVTTVQVLENHQPIKMLENKVVSDNAALNIKLQNSAKLRTFGSGNIGSGMPFKSADARVNTLSFKQKIKFINSYSFNSIGGNLRNEIQSQNTSSLWQQQSNNNETPLLSFTKLTDPIIPDRYFINNNTNLVSLNSLLPLSKDKSLRFNLYWLPQKTIYDTKTNNTFYIQGDTIKQFENQISKLKSHSLFFNVVYLLNSKLKYLQNQLTIEGNKNNGNSNIENERNTFPQTLENTTLKIQNLFLLKNTIGKELYFELMSNVNYFKSPENMTIGYGIYPWLLNNNANYNQTYQYATQEFATLLTEASLSKKVKQFMTSIKANYFAERNTYSSWLNLLQPNDEIKKAGSLYQNNLNWIQQRITINPSIDYKNKRFQLSFSFPMLSRNIYYNNKSAVFDTTISRISIHPSLRIIFELSNHVKLLLTGRRETDFTKPDNLLTGGILSNYRNLSQNLQNLQFNNINTLSISYLYRNPIKIKFFNAAFVYSKNLSPVISSQSFNLGLIQKNQQLFSNITQRVLFLANFSKYIFPLKTTIKAAYNGTILNYFQVQNNFISNLRSVTHSTSLTIATKPKWYFNSELSINFITSLSKNLSINSTIGNPINVLITNFIATFNFRENTFLQAETSYIFQHSSNNNKYFLADVRLNHTIPKTKTDIGIKAINIFNKKRFIITNIDGLQISTNNYWLRPLTLLLTASFRF